MGSSSTPGPLRRQTRQTTDKARGTILHVGAPEEFVNYRAELASVLGNREPLDAMRESMAAIAAVVEAATDEELTAATGEEWSAKDVLTHLLDAEMVWGMRIRMILAQDRPHLGRMDQEAWVRRFASLEPDPHRIFETWRVLREANLTVYASITGSEFLRVGTHDEWGELSVRTILMVQGAHGLVHARQLEVALRA